MKKANYPEHSGPTPPTQSAADLSTPHAIWAHKTKKQMTFSGHLLSNLLTSSGYQDSNLGPPAPKAGALTGLRYIP